jgi:hypothetical protein
MGIQIQGCTDEHIPTFPNFPSFKLWDRRFKNASGKNTFQMKHTLILKLDDIPIEY